MVMGISNIRNINTSDLSGDLNPIKRQTNTVETSQNKICITTRFKIAMPQNCLKKSFLPIKVDEIQVSEWILPM